MTRNILVIRLGALGDFVLSFAPFAAIRAHHAADRVTLLTTAPYRALAQASPWFDEVRIDARPAWWNLPGLLTLRRQIAGFDFVYDLQTSARSSRYFHLAGKPPWSGIAPGCSHPHANPARDRMHTLDRQREQLAMAGVAPVTPNLAWLRDTGPSLQTPYALLVPGAASHRPEKRWPAERYAALAAALLARGVRPVIVGAVAEAPAAATIRTTAPDAIDLTGRTDLLALAGIAARATLAIGNDTGPMHLAAALGTRAIVLFSGASDPALTAPRGPDPSLVTILRAERLADLPTDRVAALLP